MHSACSLIIYKGTLPDPFPISILVVSLTYTNFIRYFFHKYLHFRPQRSSSQSRLRVREGTKRPPPYHHASLCVKNACRLGSTATTAGLMNAGVVLQESTNYSCPTAVSSAPLASRKVRKAGEHIQCAVLSGAFRNKFIIGKNDGDYLVYLFIYFHVTDGSPPPGEPPVVHLTSTQSPLVTDLSLLYFPPPYRDDSSSSFIQPTKKTNEISGGSMRSICGRYRRIYSTERRWQSHPSKRPNVMGL